MSLFDLCAQLNNKSPVADEEDIGNGDEQEMAIAMHLRMRGLGYRSSKMTLNITKAENTAIMWLGNSLLRIILEDDNDGTMRDFIREKIKKYHDQYNIKKFKTILDLLNVGIFLLLAISFFRGSLILV